MPKQSAGLLLHRAGGRGVEVLLAHPGGPYWAKKDLGSWSIPKGEFSAEENALNAAKREFKEEIGLGIDGEFRALKPLAQPGGKIITVFAAEHDADVSNITSNMFEMEWPPRSGKRQEFPEVDRAAWFTLPEARVKITPGQVGFLDELERLLADR